MICLPPFADDLFSAESSHGPMTSVRVLLWWQEAMIPTWLHQKLHMTNHDMNLATPRIEQSVALHKTCYTHHCCCGLFTLFAAWRTILRSFRPCSCIQLVLLVQWLIPGFCSYHLMSISWSKAYIRNRCSIGNGCCYFRILSESTRRLMHTFWYTWNDFGNQFKNRSQNKSN